MSDQKITGWIDHDEWYPVYSIELTRKPYMPDEKLLEFTPEFVERYERVMKEFNELQDELRELDDAS